MLTCYIPPWSLVSLLCHCLSAFQIRSGGTFLGVLFNPTLIFGVAISYCTGYTTASVAESYVYWSKVMDWHMLFCACEPVRFKKKSGFSSAVWRTTPQVQFGLANLLGLVRKHIYVCEDHSAKALYSYLDLSRSSEI